MRHLVFDTDQSPPTVTIFLDGEGELAKAHAIMLITKQVKQHGMEEETAELAEIRGFSFEDLDEVVAGVLTVNDDEKSDGYFVGFSSSDRANFVGTLPIKEDDWLGNGEVFIFKTTGKAAGTYTPDEVR